MESQDSLSSVITPSLLMQLTDAYLPYSKTEELDFAAAQSDDFNANFKKVCEESNAREALVALSKLSHNGIPPTPEELDLMSLLPKRTSPEFPEQCFGLQLLLDQASRVLLTGIEVRWQVAYFGPLARRLAGQWYALRRDLRPYTWKRWKFDAGVTSFSYWVSTQVMWAAPFLHAEDLGSQQIGLELSNELRLTVEEYTYTHDPYLKIRNQTLKDDLLFIREVVKGPPKDENNSISMTTWTYWWCMILDAHWPIIARFGRYPYRNAAFGRPSTKEEEKWLDDMNHFSEAAPEDARRIREDVENGRWTPLGEN
ncbi:hypothetical protein FBEOM_2382 [Fusarium beomiforme]|uniref:Uncharacterized protein n=1 Tax=Fusarium beomiforme TaxID=44412 RepID=A0A9P5ATP6_9HYPO|nr:hypothetical protein FBEOM_2382 [Fusarium beomiforme]